MQTKNNNIFYHLVAFLTVAIWGTTFVFREIKTTTAKNPTNVFLVTKQNLFV